MARLSAAVEAKAQSEAEAEAARAVTQRAVAVPTNGDAHDVDGDSGAAERANSQSAGLSGDASAAVEAPVS